MPYIDGFVIAVPTANKEEFLAHARQFDPMFLEFGATRVVEGWGDEAPFMCRPGGYAPNAWEISELGFVAAVGAAPRSSAAQVAALNEVSQHGCNILGDVGVPFAATHVVDRPAFWTGQREPR